MADHYADDGGRYICRFAQKAVELSDPSREGTTVPGDPGRSACLKSVDRLGVGVEGLGASVAVLGSLAVPEINSGERDLQGAVGLVLVALPELAVEVRGRAM